jgi:hypothetical protein
MALKFCRKVHGASGYKTGDSRRLKRTASLNQKERWVYSSSSTSRLLARSLHSVAGLGLPQEILNRPEVGGPGQPEFGESALFIRNQVRRFILFDALVGTLDVIGDVPLPGTPGARSRP